MDRQKGRVLPALHGGGQHGIQPALAAPDDLHRLGHAVEPAQIAGGEQILLPNRHHDLVDEPGPVQSQQGPGQHGDAVQREHQLVLPLHTPGGACGGHDDAAKGVVRLVLFFAEQLGKQLHYRATPPVIAVVMRCSMAW